MASNFGWTACTGQQGETGSKMFMPTLEVLYDEIAVFSWPKKKDMPLRNQEGYLEI
jgi:hypothetical protein